MALPYGFKFGGNKPCLTRLPKHTCARCGHTWVTRMTGTPRQCPGCSRANWWEPPGRLKRGRPKRQPTPEPTTEPPTDSHPAQP